MVKSQICRMLRRVIKDEYDWVKGSVQSILSKFRINSYLSSFMTNTNLVEDDAPIPTYFYDDALLLTWYV